MSLVDIEKVNTITSIGGGPIGGGWSAHFLAKGFKVKSYIHSMDEYQDFMKIINTAWKSLKGLGLSDQASLDNLTVTSSLEEATYNSEFIQESAPENLSLKQVLYKKLGDLVKNNVVIASSTSGLMMSDIQKECSTPERTIVGHPFNPPYLLPLVEIVAGEKTRVEYIDWLKKFYEKTDKVPLVLKKEIPGFIATRLQEALWREALYMVDNDEASPEDIDLALKNGPGPRMSVQGQCMAFHVACGEGGMATNLDQFGPALKLPWTRLKAPELTKELRDKMVKGCNNMSKDTNFEKLAEKRDSMIVSVLNAIKLNK